jgi:hypothetical protein
MAIAFETHTADSNSGATSAVSQTLTVNKPTGVVSGDVIVVVIYSNEDSQSANTLSSEPTFTGWTKISEGAAYNTSSSRRRWAYYRVAGGSEPSSWDFTITYIVSGTANLVSVCSRFSGVDTANPVDVASTLDGETSSQTITFGGVTTATANTMLVMAGGSRRNLTTTYTDGTKIADSGIAGTTAAAGCVACMGYLAQVAAGASGAKSASISGGVNRENDGLIVALKQATSGPSHIRPATQLKSQRATMVGS